MLKWLTASAVVGVTLVTVQAAHQSGPPAGTPRSGAALTVRALSTDADLVTGGDLLVEVAVPRGASLSDVTVAAAGRDVSAAFKPSPARTLVGLVTGLPLGRSQIDVVAGPERASLAVTTYPITGPVLSGPWQQPFLCQSDDFALPDGSKLGQPLDANCSARTVVQYIYRPTHGADEEHPFKPLRDVQTLPEDVATTRTATGATVKFIVRVETGTMNRGIYQNAILHDPTADPPPSPLTPPAGWNRRLIAMHGVGCPSGWYVQGAAQGVSILDPVRLGEGYALFINTLNHPTNSCNAFLAGETTMMGKEHFIETFGVPFYTISTGRSGGAYTSLQIADAFPGLIDGVEIAATFPDALSIALSGLDAHLLMHYFTAVDAAGFTEAQQVAVSGYSSLKAFVDAANQAQRTDPLPDRHDIDGYQSARWNKAVPEALRYDPVRNPRGARPTVFDAAKNVYGTDPATGFALRPYDNTGVQYGLSALNAGVITVRQFLDLNERVGGFDQDANYVAARSMGDEQAIRRAYQTGLTLGANGGLRSIPIVDNATSNEAERYHYGWFHFALRERLRKAGGGTRGQHDDVAQHDGRGCAAALRPVDGGVQERRVGRAVDRQGAAGEAGRGVGRLLRYGEAAGVSGRGARIHREADVAVQHAVPGLRESPLPGWRPAGRRRAEVSAQAGRCERLCRPVHVSGTGSVEAGVSGRRVRLVQAGRESGFGRAVGVAWTVAQKQAGGLASSQG